MQAVEKPFSKKKHLFPLVLFFKYPFFISSAHSLIISSKPFFPASQPLIDTKIYVRTKKKKTSKELCFDMTFSEAAHLIYSLQCCQGAEDFRDGLAFIINIPHFAAIMNWCFLIYFLLHLNIFYCFKTSVNSISSTFLWLDLEGNSFRREIQALTPPETLLLFPGRIRKKTPPGGFWICPYHSTLFILLSYAFFFYVIQFSTPEFHWKCDSTLLLMFFF